MQKQNDIAYSWSLGGGLIKVEYYGTVAVAELLILEKLYLARW